MDTLDAFTELIFGVCSTFFFTIHLIYQKTRTVILSAISAPPWEGLWVISENLAGSFAPFEFTSVSFMISFRPDETETESQWVKISRLPILAEWMVRPRAAEPGLYSTASV
ncbi:MAG: hypothetical protein COT73_13075 [Bdellovibrio sp. CG10_big_fil_rev_8_21_14_0_10_47_8]|nr:MAG: hypothetical protein COT73_13075 [Bdellovibrio sp. CG10_big_fil_rev_8_21_14_0_10_47_8]